MKLRNEGLYAILDVDAWRKKGIELARDGVIESVAEALFKAGPSMLQLRAKHEGGRQTLELLRRLAPSCARVEIPLVANDRVDLALLAGADAVHLGQDDLPLDDARVLAPQLVMGLSTHDDAQLESALSRKPGYLAFGPVFPTESKDRPDKVVGVEATARAAKRAQEAGVPLVAIGGVGVDGAKKLAAAGVRWAAAISALVAVRGGKPELHEITRRAKALAAALRGGA